MMVCYHLYKTPTTMFYVLSHCKDPKHTFWIGTADIEMKGEKVPFLKLMAQLVRRGVAIRFIHAKELGSVFREGFDKSPVLYDRLERYVCSSFQIVLKS